MSENDSVTISLLPVSLCLVHLPRSRLEGSLNHVLRQIIQPNPTFLNVTCNEIEVSLFVEHDSVQDFHEAARKDARKLRRRERESRGEDRSRPSRHPQDDWEPVEVSSERWKVLQIDSHSDSLDSSGARVLELSAPLAAAGISILYQSSYMSDFIFVKEYRLAEVMSLLGSAGFDLYLSDPTNTSQLSTFITPTLSPGDDNHSPHLLDAASPRSIDTEGSIVFTRNRSNTSSTASSGSHEYSPIATRTAHTLDEDDAPVQLQGLGGARPHLARAPSHSPSSCDVKVLAPELTYVGLSDDNAEIWGLKVLKLIAFPDLIAGVERKPYRPPPSAPAVLVALPEEHIHVVAFGDEEGGSGSDTTTRVEPESPKKGTSPLMTLPEDTVWDEADDDSSVSADSTCADADPSRTPELGRSGRPQLPQLDTLQAVPPRSRSSSASSCDAAPPPPLVPFFSFTRTPEGSSLAAPVSLLAALFPENERHMVMCSHELDVLESRPPSPELDRDDEDGDKLAEPHGMLKCLQIDLRKFGLEKHGLVNRFSRTLEENGINHMYSSTYKTANLLIDKAHARRAEALLRSS